MSLREIILRSKEESPTTNVRLLQTVYLVSICYGKS